MTSRAYQKGISFVEMAVVLLLLSMFVILCFPQFSNIILKARLNGALQEIALLLREKKIMALSEECGVGLCFEQKGAGYTYRIYRDGNSNGIRRQDIEDGIDSPITETLDISERYRDVTFSILSTPGIPELPPGGEMLAPGGDPIRFSSDILAFSPAGTSSSGSLYLTVGDRFMVALKLFGPTGRIRKFRYDGQRKIWRII